MGYNLKTIYSQLQARQDEIERLREKVDAAKALQQEVQFLNSALQVAKTEDNRRNRDMDNTLCNL